MDYLVRTFFANGSLNKVYQSEILRNFAVAMVSVFVPLYLLQNGYTLHEIFVFFIVQSLVHIVLMIPIGKLGAQVGFKYCILASTPFIITFYYLLSTLLEHRWPLLLLAIVWEVGSSFYWLGRHVFFARTTENHKRGTQLGVAKILKAIFALPAPLLGALILAKFSIGALLIVASIILILATLPLFFVEEPKEQIRFEIRELPESQTWRTTVMFMNQGVDNVMDEIVWSIYSFFNILKQYVTLGAVRFVSEAFSLIMNFIIGRLVDLKGRKIMQWGGIGTFLVWVARYFAQTNIQVYAIDSASGITTTMTQTSFGAISYDLASRTTVVPFIAWREIFIQTGKIVAYCTVLLVGLKASFVAGVLYSLIYVFVRFESSD